MACKSYEERRQYLKGIYDESTERIKLAIARITGKAERTEPTADVKVDGSEQSTDSTEQSIDSSKQRTKRTDSSTP